MSALDFEHRWLDGTGMQGPELAATLASLRIRVGSTFVTKLLDHRTGTFGDSIQVPLYPLAESLAANWWFLTSESEPDDADNDNEFLHRHSFVNFRDGFVYPRLFAFSMGKTIRVRWRASPPGDREVAGRIEFTSDGNHFVQVSDFRRACSRLIESVTRRLSGLGIEDTFLQREWAAISGADREEIEYCETAAGLGWDPYDLDEEHRAAMGKVETLGGVRREAVPALASGSPESVIASCSAVTRAFAAARASAGCLRGLDSIRREIEPPGQPESESTPWRAGYGLAHRLRRSLGLDGALLRTTPELARALQQDPEALAPSAPVEFGAARLLDGVVATNGGSQASFAFRPLIEENRRFALCRALAEALEAPAADAVLTKAPTERQQRNRAFAAEFLAPSAALRERAPGPVLHEDDLADLAAAFGVSEIVIEHQVKNHGIARVARQASTPAGHS